MTVCASPTTSSTFSLVVSSQNTNSPPNTHDHRLALPSPCMRHVPDPMYTLSGNGSEDDPFKIANFELDVRLQVWPIANHPSKSDLRAPFAPNTAG